MKVFRLFFLLSLFISWPAFATVVVSSPANGSTVGTSVQFVASGSTGCAQGVSAMGVYVDNGLIYQAGGSSMNATLNLSPGSHRVAVQAWDYCGGATNAILNLTATSQGGVSVSSPANNSTVSAQVHYAANATTSCGSGVSAMGVYVNNSLAYTVGGSSMDTTLTLPAGTQKTVVQAWDRCGGASTTPITVNVAAGTKIGNIHATNGWNQWGELPPNYDICGSPCSGVDWSMTQHVGSGSLSGNGTIFWVGGSTPYSDALWSNKLIGQGTTQNMPDTNQTILPSIHHMVYDTDVYVSNLAVTQDLEFDINLFMYGVGMEFGMECNHLNGNVWDIWNNVNVQWVHTSIPCTLNDKSWNHVSFQVQRESNNDLTYQSITVNGTTYTINQTVAPFAVPSGWYGMTVNYQMDGNYAQTPYTTMLDNLNITYW
ncbi:Ig-like domain-containing protein [Terriglobus sp. 2YAB30_2]|uniref:Ig-like domain-containing protein n=1 Tax=Terriglobus sp. 2YAB30_2 TaxID=3233023 RepID=UPI003F9B9A3E